MVDKFSRSASRVYGFLSAQLATYSDFCTQMAYISHDRIALANYLATDNFEKCDYTINLNGKLGQPLQHEDITIESLKCSEYHVAKAKGITWVGQNLDVLIKGAKKIEIQHSNLLYLKMDEEKFIVFCDTTERELDGSPKVSLNI